MSRDRIEHVTRLLEEVEGGTPQSSDELLALLYDELRSLARARMAKLPPGDTLQPTALIHETYLRLLDGEDSRAWNSRGHFWGAASLAMWRVLVDRAREKSSLRRGGEYRRIDPIEDGLTLNLLVEETHTDDVLALDRALDRLGKDSRRTQIVLLRFLAGLSMNEIADNLGTSLRTVEREWHFARLFLFRELADDPGRP